MLSVTIFNCYAECRYANVGMMSVVRLNVVCTECRGALFSITRANRFTRCVKGEPVVIPRLPEIAVDEE